MGAAMLYLRSSPETQAINAAFLRTTKSTIRAPRILMPHSVSWWSGPNGVATSWAVAASSAAAAKDIPPASVSAVATSEDPAVAAI